VFETLESRIILQYTVKAISDLHIGGHSALTPWEVDLPVLKNNNGFPIIPGSSLKGVLRTEMERLLKGAGIETCTVPEVCKSKRGGRVIRDEQPECPVCMLFGGGALAASVRIKDATANSKKTLIRDGVAIERTTRKAKSGAKYDLEVVPVGTEFYGDVVIENPSINEHRNAKLGAVLSLIDFFNNCAGAIGGAVSRGFGQIQINIDTIRILTPEDYLAGDYEGDNHPYGSREFEEAKTQAIEHWNRYLGSLKVEKS
jgi:CRISPR-associated RAMP protein (TIGR02581 family)